MSPHFASTLVRCIGSETPNSLSTVECNSRRPRDWDSHRTRVLLSSSGLLQCRKRFGVLIILLMFAAFRAVGQSCTLRCGGHVRWCGGWLARGRVHTSK